jgi:O-antigen/teichoic acid export membrane protein
VAEVEDVIDNTAVSSPGTPSQPASSFLSNGAAMAAANLLGRGLGYVSIIVMARRLEATYIGAYALLFTASMLVELVANLGLDKLLMREIASSSAAVGEGFFWAALPIRFVMAALSASAAWGLLLVFFRHELPVSLLSVALFLATIFPVVATRNCEAFLTAHERLVPIAVSQLIERVIMFGAVLLLATGSLSFGGMLSFAPLAALFRFATVAFAMRKSWIPGVASERPHIGRLLHRSAELFMVEVLALVYFRSDVFIMAKMRGLGDTGVYQIAYKIFDVCLSLFSGFLQAAFPRMVRDKSRKTIKTQLLVGSGLLMVPVSIVIGCRHLILAVFRHQYENGATALIWLMLTVPLVFINSTFANAAIVAGRVRILGAFALLLVLLNIGLDIVLIPRWSMNGAAFVTFACELISAVVLGPLLMGTMRRSEK